MTIRGGASQDLFDLDRYPYRPAARATETSRAAAAAMDSRAPSIRDRILDLMAGGETFTPDEAAARLELSILSTRPRITELARLGKIVETGAKRTNAVSGLQAQVYKIAQGRPA